MQVRLLPTNLGAIAVLSLLCSSPVLAAGPSTITVDGSSTVYPITEAVAEEFQQKNKTRVTVGIAGTGGGFKRLCAGETDIANASRPISKEEMAACKAKGIAYYELPMAFDALTVVVNPKNTWATTMTVAELKKLWEPSAQGKITKWSQLRAGWPDQPIKLYGPGADSGTFDYFTEAVVGKAKSSRGDYTASEDDNTLVQGVSRDPNALGYFGYAYYIPHQSMIKAVGIDGGKGAVMPSKETVINSTYSPLARPLFIYVSDKAAKRPEVASFVKFYLESAPQLVSEVKYVPLPSASYTTVLSRFNTGQVGTGFAGEALAGMHIDDILKRNPVN